MEQEIVEFSVNKEELFFGRHFFKIATIALLVSISAETVWLYSTKFEFRIPIVSIIIVLPIILTSCMLFYFSNRSKAKKVKFESKGEKIEIVLLLTGERLAYRKSGLNFVKINWVLSLVFKDGKKITFFVRKDFIQFLLEKKIDVKWGAFGGLYYKRIFGFS